MYLIGRIAWPTHSRGDLAMMQDGDRTILVNVAKVIGVLVAVMITLIFVAAYIGGNA